MATALRLFIIICEEIRPVGVFNYTGTKLRQCCLVFKNVFVFMFMNEMYYVCFVHITHVSLINT